MQCYIQKLKLKVSKHMNSAVIVCNKLIGYTAHRQIVSSVLVDMQYHTPVQSNLLCCLTDVELVVTFLKSLNSVKKHAVLLGGDQGG